MSTRQTIENGLVAALLRLWGRLVEPVPSVRDPDARQEARLLAALLLVIFAITGLAILHWTLREATSASASTLDYAVDGIALLMTLVLFGLSRTVYYRWAVRLMIAVVLFAVLILARPSPNPGDVNLLAYLMIPVLFSGLLLPLREGISAVALILAASLVFLFQYTAPARRVDWFAYLLTVSLVSYLGTAYAARLARQRRSAIAASEARLRGMLTAFPDLIFRINAEGILLDCQVEDPARLFRPPQEFLGRSVREIFPEQLAAEAEALVRESLATGQLQSLEYRLSKTGETEWYEARAVPLGAQETLVVVRDITAQKVAELAQRDSEIRYRTLFQQSPVGLWEEDLSAVRQYFDSLRAQGVGDLAAYFDEHPEAVWHCARLARVLNANQTALDLVGLRTKPETLDALFSERSIAYIREELLAFDRGDLPYVSEIAQDRTDRGTVTVIVSAGLVPGHEDTWDRVFVTTVDVTARRQAQAAEQEQRALANALSDVTAVLTGTLDLDEVLDRILTQLARVVPYQTACFMLVEDGVGTIVRNQGYETFGARQQIESLKVRVSEWPTLQTMMATRAPLLIADTEADPRWIDLEVNWHLRAFVGAPIQWGEDVAGFIMLESGQPGFFTPTHAERLQAFANQAAIAVRNAQWYHAAQLHLAEMQALQRVTLDITSQLDLNRLFEVLVADLLKLCGADAGGVYLYDQESDSLVWSVSVGDTLAPIGSRLKRGEGLSGQAWVQNRPLIVEDYQNWEGRAAAYQDYAFSAVMAVPITWQGQILGVLTAVADVKRHKFTQREAQIVGLFAQQAAIAIQNARLFASECEQRTLAEALRDGLATLNTTLDLDTVLERLLVAVERVVPYDAANIMLLERNTAYIARHRGYPSSVSPHWADHYGVLTIARPELYRAIRANHGLIVADTHTDPDWQPHDELGWVRAHLTAPIRVQERVIGLLNLESRTPQHFTATHLQRAQAFADQAAIAIQNARLYAEVRQHRDDLERVVAQRTLDLSVRNTVAETLSSSLDLVEMLNGVLRVAVDQLSVRGGAIYLLTPTRKDLELQACWGVSPSVINTVTGFSPGALPYTPQHMHIAPGSAPSSTASTPQIAAVLSVPIWRQDKIEGVITLVHDQPRAWQEGETRMLDAIGRQIGVALANARSYADAVQREAHIRAILRNAAEGLLVFDAEGQVALINPAAETLLAFYPVEQGGAAQAAVRLYSWLADQLPAGSERPVEIVLPVSGADQSALDTECEFPDCPVHHGADPSWPCWLYPGGPALQQVSQCALFGRGMHRAVQVQAAAVVSGSEAPLGTVLTLHDVSYFRELDDLKGRFVSTVSHELRTPLSTILLQVSTLLRYYEQFSEEERRTMIEEMQDQAQVLRDLIEDILELSRFDAHRSLPQKQWFDLVLTCENVLDELGPAIEGKHLTIDRSGCEGSRHVMADPAQIARVLRNLISNAVKYTPAGGTIRLRSWQRDGKIALEVSDSGIGIAPDDLPHIFDRFYRAEEAIRVASGTGLGLAISKEIAEMHGGTITVSSTPGAGSTFALLLPVTEIDIVPR